MGLETAQHETESTSVVTFGHWGDKLQQRIALLKQLGGGVSIGPVLLGAAKPIHIATRSITTRGLLNMAALAVAGAASKDQS